MESVTYYLKFTSSEEAKSTIHRIFGDIDFGEDYAIDYVGELCKIDETTGDIIRIDGFHVNIATTQNLSEDFSTFLLPVPQYPKRVFV